MTEAKIGRLLVASLHQAIVDVLPARLEFYEYWLNEAGLREGTIGRAPFTAVLSFLRREPTYALVTARAGRYAAEWATAGLPAIARTTLRALPPALRARAVWWLACSLTRRICTRSRAAVRLRRSTATVDLRGSPFCEVRQVSSGPLCGFYASAFVRLFELFNLKADATISGCRASGQTGCRLSVIVRDAGAAR